MGVLACVLVRLCGSPSTSCSEHRPPATAGGWTGCPSCPTQPLHEAAWSGCTPLSGLPRAGLLLRPLHRRWAVGSLEALRPFFLPFHPQLPWTSSLLELSCEHDTIFFVFFSAFTPKLKEATLPRTNNQQNKGDVRTGLHLPGPPWHTSCCPSIPQTVYGVVLSRPQC